MLEIPWLQAAVDPECLQCRVLADEPGRLMTRSFKLHSLIDGYAIVTFKCGFCGTEEKALVNLETKHSRNNQDVEEGNIPTLRTGLRSISRGISTIVLPSRTEIEAYTEPQNIQTVVSLPEKPIEPVSLEELQKWCKDNFKQAFEVMNGASAELQMNTVPGPNPGVRLQYFVKGNPEPVYNRVLYTLDGEPNLEEVRAEILRDVFANANGPKGYSGPPRRVIQPPSRKANTICSECHQNMVNCRCSGALPAQEADASTSISIKIAPGMKPEDNSLQAHFSRAQATARTQ